MSDRTALSGVRPVECLRTEALRENTEDWRGVAANRKRPVQAGIDLTAML